MPLVWLSDSKKTCPLLWSALIKEEIIGPAANTQAETNLCYRVLLEQGRSGDTVHAADVAARAQ